MGDLNSYAMEQTLTEIKAGHDDIPGTGDDFTNLVVHFQGPFAYSYTFDGQAGSLDHALANASLFGQVTGAEDWHINSDEPSVLDYDTTFKPAEQEALYEPTPSARQTTTRSSSGSTRTPASRLTQAALLGPRRLHRRRDRDRDRPERRHAHVRVGSGRQRLVRDSRPDRDLLGRVRHGSRIPHDPRAGDRSGGLSAVDSATVTITVTYDSLCALTEKLVTKKGVEKDLCKKLEEAEKAEAKGSDDDDKKLDEYRKEVEHESGKAISAAGAAQPIALSYYL